MSALPFDLINRAALAILPRLLLERFPAGRLCGHEFRVGNIAGDRGDSLAVNVNTGEWCDFAAQEHRGGDPISLWAAAFHRGNQGAAAHELGRATGVFLNGVEHAATRPSTQKTATGDIWEPMVPAPSDAPPPPDRLFAAYGAVYDYRGVDDKLLFYVRRQEARDGKSKQFHALVYGRLNGILDWHSKHPAAPKQLYGLNRLAVMPDAAVILCEGEKSANAAQDLFHQYACLSWFGGSNATEQADLTPLAGRQVILWPDNDRAGHEAVAKLAKRMPGARVLRVDDLAESADAADIPPPDDPDEWIAHRLELPASENIPGVADFLSVYAWADREMPEPDRLLGDLLTTTSRVFLVGRTGLGKTLLAVAMGCGMAAGSGFLHWRSSRPARVLLIDGEMPGELIKARAIDVLRRASVKPRPDNLVIFARDMEDEFARRFPTLGKMEPLNTESGQNYVHALIAALGGVDVVIFDNVMSLIAGDQKDEVPWSETSPLVSSLTAKRIAQIWLDHTGHNTDRQYGSSTKAWRFDAAGLMTPLPDDQCAPYEVAFQLSFEPPGKARRRTPDNWQDFQSCIIRLREDQWTSEPVERATTKTSKLSPTAQLFYRALLDALAISKTPGHTTRTAWYNECVGTGIVDPIAANESWKTADAKKSKLRKYQTELKLAGLIGVDGEIIHALRHGRPAK